MNSVSYPRIAPFLAILVAICVGVAIGVGFVVLDQPVAPSDPATEHDATVLLTHLQSDISTVLEALDGRLSHVDFGDTDLSESTTRGVPVNLNWSDLEIVCGTLPDADGGIVAADPAFDIDGQSPEDQDHALTSEVFPEVIVTTPVFSGEEPSSGATPVTFSLYDLLDGIADPAANDTPTR